MEVLENDRIDVIDFLVLKTLTDKRLSEVGGRAWADRLVNQIQSSAYLPTAETHHP